MYTAGYFFDALYNRYHLILESAVRIFQSMRCINEKDRHTLEKIYKQPCHKFISSIIYIDESVFYILDFIYSFIFRIFKKVLSSFYSPHLSVFL